MQRLLQKIPLTLRVISILLVIALIGGGIFFLTSAKEQSSEDDMILREYPVTKGTLTASIDENGTLEQDTTTYSFKTPFTLKELYVKTGQKVKVGDNLAEVFPDSVEKELLQLRNDLQQAHSTLEDALNQKRKGQIEFKQGQNEATQTSNEQYETARNTLLNAIAELNSEINQLKNEIEQLEKRLEELKSTASTESDNDAEIKRLEQQLQEKNGALESAQNKQSLKQTELDQLDAARTKQVRQEEETRRTGSQLQGLTEEGQNNAIENACLAVKNLEDKIKSMEGLLKEPLLKAEHDGVITKTEFQAGDEIPAGKPIVSLGHEGKFHAKATVSQEEITKISTGQKIEMHPLAYSNKTLQGKVKEKYLEPLKSDEGVGYEVLIELDKTDLEILSGMTGSIKFITKKLENVLCLSDKAIQLEEGAQTVTIKHKDGSTEKRQISTGFSDGRMSEVTQGLHEGDIVVTKG